MKPTVFLLLMLALSLTSKAQDIARPSSDSIHFSGKELDKYLSSVDRKVISVEEKLDKTTEKYLSKLQKQEAKIQKKFLQKDTALAHQLFDGIEAKYAALRNAPQKLSKAASVYSGHLDSLTTALNFLKNNNLTNNPELQKTLSQFSSLQNKFNQTETIKKFIGERRRLLKESLEKLGMLKELKGFQKQAYYYSAQIREYKAMWEDPEKLEKKLMEWVMKTDKFKEFFRQNSMLGSLFALPGGPLPASPNVSL